MLIVRGVSKMIDSSIIKQEAIRDFESNIGFVISGEEDVAISELISAGDINEYIKSIGEEVGELETNGWQYDFWQNYKINSKYYCLSGSGYYGGLEFSEISEESALGYLDETGDIDSDTVDYNEAIRLIDRVNELLKEEE